MLEERLLVPGYYIERLLARGGMGEVYFARRCDFGTPVAVKVLSAELSRSEHFRGGFIREARLMAAVRHPNIVPVVDVGKTIDGRYYIALHYIEGKTVEEIMERVGAMNEDEVAWVGYQVAEALAAAHKKGILHRDVKPANIIINEEGRAFLCDFGLALPVGSDVMEGVLSGTPHYMSPEQARGSTNLPPQSDVYSLAATLYHMLYGRPLFEAKTPEQVAVKQIKETPHFPEGPSKEMKNLLKRMLAKDPAKRPPSSDVATTLKAFYEGRKTQQHTKLSSPFLPFLKRWWWVFALGAGGILLVLLL